MVTTTTWHPINPGDPAGPADLPPDGHPVLIRYRDLSSTPPGACRMTVACIDPAWRECEARRAEFAPHKEPVDPRRFWSDCESGAALRPGDPDVIEDLVILEWCELPAGSGGERMEGDRFGGGAGDWDEVE